MAETALAAWLPRAFANRLMKRMLSLSMYLVTKKKRNFAALSPSCPETLAVLLSLMRSHVQTQ